MALQVAELADDHPALNTSLSQLTVPRIQIIQLFDRRFRRRRVERN
jgi:hypothetical protein